MQKFCFALLFLLPGSRAGGIPDQRFFSPVARFSPRRRSAAAQSLRSPGSSLLLQPVLPHRRSAWLSQRPHQSLQRAVDLRRRAPARDQLSPRTDYVGSHTLGIQRPLDVDPPTSFIRNAPDQVRTAQAANCTRPYWVAWYAQNGGTCDPIHNSGPTPPYSVIQSDVNDGMASYDALDANLSDHFHNGSALLASYVWSHTLDTVDSDTTSQNPNDQRCTGRQCELGNAIFDQRNRLVLSGVYAAPFGFTAGGVATFAGGLPYNFVTGASNSGDTGATTARPVINGAVVGRDTGRGTPIYSVDPFIGKTIPLGTERVHALLRAEAFNVLNHRNDVGFSGTWGDGATAASGFGQPLAGLTAQLPAREMQFSAKIEF